jgi:benzoylformate decarboxylase
MTLTSTSSYRLLQLNIEQFWSERGIETNGHPLPFDLSEPPIQFAGLAKAMGIRSLRVERPWNVEDAIEQMLGHPGPFLVDVVLEGDVHPEMIGVHCGQ